MKRIFSFSLIIASFLFMEEEWMHSKNLQNEDNMMEKVHKYTNQLIHETSPYLLQHAHNPVNWYPWGEEALSKARKENKPIFLSIGYSACHWCHVMEKESFEQEEIAKILNQHFISIKVDREERPDLDEIYMAAVVAISGSGGWPMTVFLTPELKPFFGGTYFPPEERWGRTGFKDIIIKISQFWHDEEKRKKLTRDAEMLKQMIEERTSVSVSQDKNAELSQKLLDNAAHQLEETFDAEWGGFSGAPKFPSSQAISFLLRDYHHNGNKESFRKAILTLDKMYEGGMYDHLGGGFHRYSTDRMWLVPHFEKMLYDNAQLAVVYLEAYQLTGNDRYARVAREIFSYEMEQMADNTGGFYSTEDADSEGKEGVFYLWKFDELEKLLGEEESRIFSAAYSVKKNGNFSSHETYHQGLNILHIQRDLAVVAKDFAMKEAEFESKLQSIKDKLIKVRDQRVRPGLDDKIITSWNGLMISGFARGFQVLGDKKYLQAAEEAASFIMKKMQDKNGRLLRTYRNGRSKFSAYLEDYAYSVRAFIDLYEAAFDEHWLFAADNLAQEMINQFWDKENSGFYNTGKYHKNLIVRTKSLNDGALPSPTGVALEGLLRLAKFLDRENYFKKVRHTLQASYLFMDRVPQGYLSLLFSVDFLVHPPKEIAIVGRRGSEDAQKLLRTIHEHYIPNRVIAFIDPAQDDAQSLMEKIPILSGRKMIEGRATAYVCANYTCQLPMTTAEALLKQL